MIPVHRLPDNRIPVLLSAHEEELIGQDAAGILDYLERLSGTEDPTAAVAAALLRTRRVRRHRAVVRAADRAELEAGLQALSADTPHALVARSPQDVGLRTAFVFPGQGNQWPSMGAEAYERLSVYRAEAQRCAEAFAAAGLPSPLSYLLALSAEIDRGWSQVEVQGAHFTHAASLARLWQSCGVLPDMTVGHSLGEVAAAYVAGAISLPDAVAVVAARATVVGRLTGRYGMALLAVGVDQAEQLIAKTPGWLEVSVVNSPSSSVVSGEQDSVAAVVRLAEEQSIFSRLLPVDFPAHTSKLESLRGAMRDLLPASTFLEAPVEFVSSAHGGVLTSDTDFVDYWYQNLRNTVRFDEAVRTAMQRGAGRFLEMSAHPALHYALGEVARDAVIVGSGRRDESVVEQLSANIAAAAVADADYRWSGLVDVTGQRLLRGFPTAPMRAIHLWATPEPLPPVPGAGLTVVHEEWEPRPDPQTTPNNRPVANVAVVASEGADESLTHRLTEAVAAHQGCHLTGPAEADIAVVIAPSLVTPEVVAAVDQIRCMAGSLDYRAAVGSNCRRVWLITTGAEQVDPDSSAGLPAQAALAAMHRSIGFEFPDCVFAHFDLPRGDIDPQAAQRCVNMLLGTDTEVALRDSGCFVRNLRECAEPSSEGVLDTAPLDNVVITGGGGTIGLRYARHCIERGARRVILLSRRGVDEAEVSRLIQGHATEVHAPECDITDADALSVVADKYAGDGASLLIHAAGVARFGKHDQLGDADLADVFSAKVTGLVQLIDVWPVRQDVRILLCSSVSGVWGGYGHAAYAAANRMLDIVAAQLRAKGLDCRALRWGLWRGTAIAGAEEITRIERSGLVAMDPDAAVAAGLCHHPGDPLIMAADLDRLRIFFRSQGASMAFTTPVSAPRGDAVPDGAGSDPKSIADVVRAEVAAVLSLGAPSSVDLSAALVDLGADSLLALDLRDRLRQRTGQSVPAARLLDGTTSAQLIESLQSAQATGQKG